MLIHSAAQIIGDTPLLQAERLMEKEGLCATLLLKLEAFNPGGSVKDRVALSMIESAEKDGLLTPGAVIIEPTSGNTGIGLASVATTRGYRCIIVMPDTMSMERRRLIAAYGAELVLTPGALGMQGAIDEATRLQKEIPGSFIPNQFGNANNPLAHYEGTGPEIWRDTEGKVDIFVAGVGTGGTLTGTARYLKEKNPNVQIVAVEPKNSPLLSEGRAGSHGLQGIGANFVPEILDRALIDEIVTVAEEDAYASARELGKTEGVLVGISAGAALYAAMELARRPENKGKRIVALMPDGGERYLSTELYK